MFFHIFNHLHQSGKQIVMTSDCPPRDLKGLEERLLSRFKWGLTADLQSPDFETRMAIIHKKMQSDGIDIPDNVVEILSRKTERALNHAFKAKLDSSPTFLFWFLGRTTFLRNKRAAGRLKDLAEPERLSSRAAMDHITAAMEGVAEARLQVLLGIPLVPLGPCCSEMAPLSLGIWPFAALASASAIGLHAHSTSHWCQIPSGSCTMTSVSSRSAIRAAIFTALRATSRCAARSAASSRRSTTSR
jgi:hypothetical protein